MEDEFLSVKQVRQAIPGRIARKTVYGFIHSGKLPAFRWGRQWQVKRTDLDTFLEAGRHYTKENPHGNETS